METGNELPTCMLYDLQVFRLVTRVISVGSGFSQEIADVRPAPNVYTLSFRVGTAPDYLGQHANFSDVRFPFAGRQAA